MILSKFIVKSFLYLIGNGFTSYETSCLGYLIKFLYITNMLLTSLIRFIFYCKVESLSSFGARPVMKLFLQSCIELNIQRRKFCIGLLFYNFIMLPEKFRGSI
jgi:hypothetical protein